jgi:hypothetical protein
MVTEVQQQLMQNWKRRREDLDTALDLLEQRVLGTHTHEGDTTAETIADVRRYIAELDKIIEQFGMASRDYGATG